jgi:hypothetical protein
MLGSWGAAPSPALRELKPFLEKGFKNPKNFIQMCFEDAFAYLLG